MHQEQIWEIILYIMHIIVLIWKKMLKREIDAVTYLLIRHRVWKLNLILTNHNHSSLQHTLNLLSRPWLHQPLLGDSTQHFKLLPLCSCPYQLGAVSFAGPWPGRSLLVQAGICFQLRTDSHSQLLYSWWVTTNQFILVPSPSRLMTPCSLLTEPLLS
jgi:hypothetical protein